MNLTLKPETEQLIKERVERGDYKNASDLVDEAIHRLFEMDNAEAEFEALVQEGIESGPGTEMTKEDFDSIRCEVLAKYNRQRE